MANKKNNTNDMDGKDLSQQAEELRSLCNALSKKPDVSTAVPLVTIRRSDREELRLTWASYDGHPYLNVSLWRMDTHGVLRPVGEKTMSVRIHELADFAHGLQKAMKLASEEISRREDD